MTDSQTNDVITHRVYLDSKGRHKQKYYCWHRMSTAIAGQADRRIQIVRAKLGDVSVILSHIPAEGSASRISDPNNVFVVTREHTEGAKLQAVTASPAIAILIAHDIWTLSDQLVEGTAPWLLHAVRAIGHVTDGEMVAVDRDAANTPEELDHNLRCEALFGPLRHDE